MRPEPQRVLEQSMQTLFEEIAPALVERYRQSTAGIIGPLLLGVR